MHPGCACWPGSAFWFPSISIPTGIKGHVAQHVTLAGDGGACPRPGHPNQGCEQIMLTLDGGQTYTVTKKINAGTSGNFNGCMQALHHTSSQSCIYTRLIQHAVFRWRPWDLGSSSEEQQYGSRRVPDDCWLQRLHDSRRCAYTTGLPTGESRSYLVSQSCKISHNCVRGT